MEPTNLQIAIVERDMVRVYFGGDFADCGEGRRGGCWLAFWRDGSSWMVGV